jgi:hypothetical protein
VLLGGKGKSSFKFTYLLQVRLGSQPVISV